MNADVKSEIRSIIHSINKCWIDGHANDIAQYFHENVVIARPGFESPGRGRDACAQSYVDFCANARIINFNQTDADVEVFGDTAVATYRFEIAYEMSGTTYNETGSEIIVFTREGTEWLVAWRTVLTDNAPPAG